MTNFLATKGRGFLGGNYDAVFPGGGNAGSGGGDGDRVGAGQAGHK